MDFTFWFNSMDYYKMRANEEVLDEWKKSKGNAHWFRLICICSDLLSITCFVFQKGGERGSNYVEKWMRFKYKMSYSELWFLRWQMVDSVNSKWYQTQIIKDK